MIRLLIGDRSTRKDHITLDKLTLNKLRTGQLTGGRFLVDLDAGRFHLAKVKSIIKACTVDLDLRTQSYDKYDKLKGLVDKVEDAGGHRGLNIFHLLVNIFSNADRDKVFELLEAYKPPLEVLLKWIIGNLEEDDEENMDWMNRIDEHLYKVDRRIIHLMIAQFEPIYSARMRFYWNFKRKGE
jgi:hypothetical protein